MAGPNHYGSRMVWHPCAKGDWMTRKRSVGSAAAILAFIAALTVNKGGTIKAAGPVCSVPGDYATIQTALADPGCTTINVGPGLYTANVTVNHAVVINGAQAGVPIAGRTFGA